MNIRAESSTDIDRIRRVNEQAFETGTEANLVDALRLSGVELISLVAEERGEVIGHILFSPVTLDKQAKIKIAGLAPMAVLPEWQRKGVGSELVQQGMKACEQAGYAAIVVLGHPEYYPRFGFTPSVDFGIKSEYDVPPEVFMVRELFKGALEGQSGTIHYHTSFGDV